MQKLFQNKYRVSSARLQSWDYANEGFYFVTICTKNREYYFGEIMRPSKIGEIAALEWYKTVQLRPDMNLELGEFVVMPNHVHGIIIIGENKYNTPERRDAMHRVSTGNIYGPQSNNLGSIIRGYKSAVTTYARKHDIVFDWQSRYHDHIIRSEEEYINISNYIINNPARWKEDRFYES